MGNLLCMLNSKIANDKPRDYGSKVGRYVGGVDNLCRAGQIE